MPARKVINEADKFFMNHMIDSMKVEQIAELINLNYNVALDYSEEARSINSQLKAETTVNDRNPGIPYSDGQGATIMTEAASSRTDDRTKQQPVDQGRFTSETGVWRG